MAFLARSLQGASSGNVGIIRTAVAEMVPQKELQPRAFSIMPLVWYAGSNIRSSPVQLADIFLVIQEYRKHIRTVNRGVSL